MGSLGVKIKVELRRGNAGNRGEKDGKIKEL